MGGIVWGGVGGFRVRGWRGVEGLIQQVLWIATSWPGFSCVFRGIRDICVTLNYFCFINKLYSTMFFLPFVC